MTPFECKKRGNVRKLALPRNDSVSLVYQERSNWRDVGGNVVDYRNRSQLGHTCFRPSRCMGVLGLTPFLHKTWCVLLD
jgi:hypothetical protein